MMNILQGGIDQLRIANEFFQTFRQPEYDGKRWNITQDGGISMRSLLRSTGV